MSSHAADDEEEDRALAFINNVFPNQSFYEILSVTKDASEEDIKKSYRRLALKYHPDRPGGSEEHFKAISIVYSTLSDAEKRKIYDQEGQLAAAEGMSGDFDFWYKYYREMFPAVTVEGIEEYKRKYLGSEEEKTDLLNVYRQHKGDLDMMMNYVMFAEIDSREDMERVCAAIDAAISMGEVDEYKAYARSKREVMKRIGSGKKARIANEIDLEAEEIGEKEEKEEEEEEEKEKEEVKEDKKGKNKAKESATKKNSGKAGKAEGAQTQATTKSKSKSKKESSFEALAAAIALNKEARQLQMQDIAAKYEAEASRGKKRK